MSIDLKNWTKFAQTDNADFYQVDESILAVVPHEGCTDDDVTAKASIDTQLAYLRAQNKKAGVVIFVDGIAQQTAGARHVYRDMVDSDHQVCFVLVGGTVFGRAVGSIFLGLAKPCIPTKMFTSPEQAVDWCHEQVKKR